LEFGSTATTALISIWNNTNAGFFHAAQVKAFGTPVKKNSVQKNLELAKQPLLLLMLALYDSARQQPDKANHFDLHRVIQ
jgi:hypothetical protein